MGRQRGTVLFVDPSGPDSAEATARTQPEIGAGLGASAGEGFCSDCHEDAGVHDLRCPHFDLDGLARRVAVSVAAAVRLPVTVNYGDPFPAG